MLFKINRCYLCFTITLQHLLHRQDNTNQSTSDSVPPQLKTEDQDGAKDEDEGGDCEGEKGEKGEEGAGVGYLLIYCHKSVLKVLF